MGHSLPDRLGQAHPLPDPVRVELDRVLGLWSRLPAQRAERGLPVMAAALSRLAALGPAAAAGAPASLGLRVVADQLAVLAWDASVPPSSHEQEMVELLRVLRADLAAITGGPGPV